MTTWKMADGTALSLGGRVEGDSDLAERLREQAKRTRSGYPVRVAVRPMPGGMENLDLNDLRTVDAWVREQAHRAGVEVLEGPEVEPDVRPGDDSDDGLDEDGRPKIY